MATCDINNVCLTGRLTRDSELKSTTTGVSVCRFSIAVNRRQKNGDSWTDEVSYFDIVLWGKTGESLSRYLTKGRQVSVNGELRQSRWEQDGKKFSKVEVYADKIVLAGGSEGTENAARSQTSSYAQGSVENKIMRDFNGADVPF